MDCTLFLSTLCCCFPIFVCVCVCVHMCIPFSVVLWENVCIGSVHERSETDESIAGEWCVSLHIFTHMHPIHSVSVSVPVPVVSPMDSIAVAVVVANQG